MLSYDLLARLLIALFLSLSWQVYCKLALNNDLLTYFRREKDQVFCITRLCLRCK